ncbi:diguanylate cyclase [Candidatus Fermentibacterales bacterium]|nr:diguanylate cyclase [Candidatus Fermentibacterales bacterium]
MELINGRYSVKKTLSEREGVSELLVADAAQRDRLRVLRLVGSPGDPVSSGTVDKTYAWFRALRGAMSPCLACPEDFGLVRLVDGELVDPWGVFWVRDYIPGNPGLALPEQRRTDLLRQLLEAFHYMEADGIDLASLRQANFIVTQGEIPLISVLDPPVLPRGGPPADEGSIGPLIALLDEAGELEALSGDDTMSGFIETLRENPSQRPGQALGLFPRNAGPGLPILSALSHPNSAQLGMSTAVEQGRSWLGQCAAGERAPVLLLVGRSSQLGSAVLSDLSAEAEYRGWCFQPAGTRHDQDVYGEIATTLEERLGAALPSGGDHSEPPVDAEKWIQETLPAVCSRVPLALEVRQKQGFDWQVSTLVRSLLSEGDSRSPLALIVRADRPADLAVDASGQPSLCSLDLPGPIQDHLRELVSRLLCTSDPPEGLVESLERHQASDPLTIISMLRLLLSNDILTRDGAGWRFSLSRERALGISTRQAVDLSALARLDSLDRDILSFLSFFRSRVGRAALAHVLEVDSSTLRVALQRLRQSELVTQTEARGSGLFSAAPGLPEELLVPYSETRERWARRLVFFALTFPAAHLEELLLASRLSEDNLEEKATLLYSALHLASEIADPDIQCRLFEEIATLPSGSLSASQIRSVLNIVDPSRLSFTARSSVRRFLSSVEESSPIPADDALVLVRAAQIDLQEGNAAAALNGIERAFDLLRDTPPGPVLPTAMAVYRNGGRASGSMDRVLERTLELVSGIDPKTDPSVLARLYCEATMTAAARRDLENAAEYLQKAEELLPGSDLIVQQAHEQSKAEVLMLQGRLTEARKSFERALLLAESRDDQDVVVALLDSIVSCEERLPGFSLRVMAQNMVDVCERAALRSDRFFLRLGWGKLAGLYTRTLETGSARKAVELARNYESGLTGIEDDTLDWFAVFLDYLGGSVPEETEPTGLLPATPAFLRRLLEGGEPPREEASKIADRVREQGGQNNIMLGLYLAMEAASFGCRDEASVIARALADAYRPRSDEYIPAWKLCISALLAPRGSESERALISAQVLARQTDRLLLTWQVLRVRQALEHASQEDLRACEIGLLLEELDRHLMGQLEEADRWDRGCLSGHRETWLKELESGADASLRELRDSLGSSVSGSLDEKVDRLALLSADPVGQSDIQWGLEALRIITGASRVQVLRNPGEGFEVLHSRGLGGALEPSPEVLAALGEMTDQQFVIDNFGVTPFGPRLTHVVSLDRRNAPVGVPGRRRTDKTTESTGSFLLVEMESPFNVLTGPQGRLVSCFARQIAVALAFSDLERQTYYDSMTGAAIRPVWLSTLRDMISESSATGKPLSVLMIDLDFFKSVNDSFGHREGDLVLRGVVDAMASALRPTDRIGRLGGEEFGVALPRTSRRNALIVAERLRKRVSERVFRPDRRPITISIGVSACPVHGDSPELLVRRADVALYESKRSGRNRVTVWTETMASTFVESGRPSLLDTGDPGWDQMLGQTVLQLLSQGVAPLSSLVDDLRNALRCEYLFLEDRSGRSASVGPPEFARAFEDIEPGRPGQPTQTLSSDWKHQCMSVSMDGGGRLLAAWQASDPLPAGLPTIFCTLANLSRMLMTDTPGQVTQS